jgi:hypothetical protein
MATPSDNLPPNLKVLAEMLQSVGSHPATGGLLAELALIADRTPRGVWEAAANLAAPAPQILALALAGSFAASGALSISVSGGGGITLEDCPMPGCLRRRTTK